MEQITKLELKPTLIPYGIRPKSFKEFIGQTGIKKNLQVFIKSAKLRNQALDHILISGPPGLGKTTLSNIIASELGVEIISSSGPLIERQGDLAAILTNLKTHQVLFIDEIHRLNKQIEEVLYSAMEDYKLDLIIGQGPSARTLKVELKHFTLIGATTRQGMLSSPLRDRFGIPISIDYYTVIQLQQIINQSAKLTNIELTDEASYELAKRSRGTPRIANRYLRRCHDYALVSEKLTIDYETVILALQQLEIDAAGLDKLDLRYLKLLSLYHERQAVGLETIAIALSEDKDTIELVCEPYLIRLGLIKKTNRGRMLTVEGEKYISLSKQNQKENL